MVARCLAPRPLAGPPHPRVQEEALMAAAEKVGPTTRNVEVSHFAGGPCDDSEVVCCLVPGGAGKGWTVVNGAKHPGKDGAGLLAVAVSLAATRHGRRKGGQGALLAGGAAARLVGLQVRAHFHRVPPHQAMFSPAFCCLQRTAHNTTWEVVEILVEWWSHPKRAARQARPDLNGQVGVLLKFNGDTGRWMVRLGDGSGKQVSMTCCG